LLGDTLSETQRESYVAAQAFSGEYYLTVRRIWGRPLGGKATLEIIQHQGTPQESRRRETVVFDRLHTMTFSLPDGRRTSLAQVPPPDANRPKEPEVKPADGDRVLTKLRALADPTFVGSDSGLRGGVASLGVPAETKYMAKTPERNPAEVLAYQAKVDSFAGNGLDMTAQAVVSPDRRYVRLSMTPVFQTLAKAQAGPLVNNPLIPGGVTPPGVK
jgi:hypothetical protein